MVVLMISEGIYGSSGMYASPFMSEALTKLLVTGQKVLNRNLQLFPFNIVIKIFTYYRHLQI